MIPNARAILSAALLILLSASLALGAAITITPSGNGVFTIQGNSMDGVGGIDLTVNYDNSALASPSVSQGALVSGAMFAANPNFSANSIRIAIISTKSFSGSGPIATISFGTHSGEGSLAVTSSMITTSGSPMLGGGRTTANDFQTSSSNTVKGSPAGTYGGTAVTSGGSVTTGTTGGASGGSSVTTLGTVSMPADYQPKGETKPSEPPANVPPPAIPAPIETEKRSAEPPPVEQKTEPAQAAEVKQTTYISVLRRFLRYQGEKKPAAMIALFSEPVAATIRQEPYPAISNGATRVKISVDLPSTGRTAPNFSLTGAKMISLKRDDKSGSWILEVLPETGVIKTTVTILSGSSIIDYPLTVVPPVADFSPAEADFAAFLKDSGAKPAKHDLNGDGKHDFRDDFIYTGHYLIRKNTPPVKGGAAPQQK